MLPFHFHSFLWNSYDAIIPDFKKLTRLVLRSDLSCECLNIKWSKGYDSSEPWESLGVSSSLSFKNSYSLILFRYAKLYLYLFGVSNKIVASFFSKHLK